MLFKNWPVNCSICSRNVFFWWLLWIEGTLNFITRKGAMMFRLSVMIGLLSLATVCSAATGCAQGNKVFQNHFLGIWYGEISSSCPPGASTSIYYARIHSTSNDYCNIQILGAGKLVTYSIEQCPLDDYTWALFIIIGGGAVYKLRKKI